MSKKKETKSPPSKSMTIEINGKFVSLVSLAFTNEGPFKGTYLLQTANHEKKRYTTLAILSPYEIGAIKYLVSKALKERPLRKKKGMRIFVK